MSRRATRTCFTRREVSQLDDPHFLQPGGSGCTQPLGYEGPRTAGDVTCVPPQKTEERGIGLKCPEREIGGTSGKDRIAPVRDRSDHTGKTHGGDKDGASIPRTSALERECKPKSTAAQGLTGKMQLDCAQKRMRL